MFRFIKNGLQNRRDRREMVVMRSMIGRQHSLLFPQHEQTGILVRIKTGLKLTQLLETRLGLMAPDFMGSVHTDWELEEESKILDNLHPDQLNQLAAEFARVAGRTIIEKGEPGTWEGGEETANVADLLALRILSNWLRCKAIAHTSMSRKIVLEARELEALFYLDIKRLMRIFRGERAIKDGEE